MFVFCYSEVREITIFKLENKSLQFSKNFFSPSPFHFHFYQSEGYGFIGWPNTLEV